jgi:hypothetical protein
MEDYGLILYTLCCLGISSVLSLIALIFRPLRRFSLAVFSTPPAVAVLLFFTRWSVIDNSRVCGPDPEWDRCPSTYANIMGWVAWVIGIIVVAVAAYWAQKVIQAAIGLWFDSRPLSLFCRPNNSATRVDPPEMPLL